MQFAESAPGLLHDVGGEWVGYWDADDTIASWVSSALNNPLGWGRAGVTFSRSSSAVPRVVFHMVDAIPGNPSAIGIAMWSEYDGREMVVYLESAYEGNMDLVNHEACHAFFWATHSPEGSGSIMEPMEDPGEEWPSDTDITQVATWLGTTTDPSPGNPQNDSGPVLRWFPADLPDYTTSFPIPSGARGRVTANVTGAARVVLHAINAGDHESLMAGDYARFSTGLDAYEVGLAVGAWRTVPSGERHVGVIAQAENEDEFDSLKVGLLEVQIRGERSGDVLPEPPPSPCSPERTISFTDDAPGRLTVEGEQVYGDYRIAADNFGYTEAEARAIVAGALESPAGWDQAGITFRETEDAPVTFRFVSGPFDCGGVSANGCTTPSGATALVELSYQRAEAGYGRNLVNHESGHAYFGATHSGNGIMSGDSIEGWPTDCDTRSVAAWLG